MKKDTKQISYISPNTEMPKNLEAETSVLGAIIQESTAFSLVTDILNADCFYFDANKDVFAIIYDLSNENKPIDLITISQKIDGKQSIILAGGLNYVIGLTTGVLSSANIVQHSLFLLELAAKRKTLNTCMQVQGLIKAGADVGEVLELMQTSTDESLKSFNPISQSLDLLVVHLSDLIQEAEPILKQGDINILDRGDISTIKAKAKAGKSFLSSILVSSCFGDTSYGLDADESVKTVLVIDTEQNKAHVHKYIRRIHKMNNWQVENKNLIVLSLRECSVSERQNVLIKSIDRYKPDLVVVDGGVDLVNDFNDPTESKQVIGLFMKLSTKHNCHIVNILHEGKGNGELRGHYGAEALNKSATIFQVDKDGDTVAVSAGATRNMPFSNWSFRIDERGLPVYVGEMVKATKAEMTKAKMKPIFKTILGTNSKPYSELAKLYSEFAGVAGRTATRHVATALKDCIIKLDSKGEYILTDFERNEILDD